MHIGNFSMVSLHLLEMTRSILVHLLVQNMMSRIVILQQCREHRRWRLNGNGARDLHRYQSLSLPGPTLLRLVMLALRIAVGPGVALLALLVATSSACGIRWKT
jgi:hypothetical protein